MVFLLFLSGLTIGLAIPVICLFVWGTGAAKRDDVDPRVWKRLD